MSPDVLDGLEDVHFSVLDDLLYASVGRKVHPNPRSSIPIRVITQLE